MTRARRLVPDLILGLGVLGVLAGAYLISVPLALIAAGVGLIALAIWMGA